MIQKSFSIASAVLIAMSSPLAQAVVKPAESVDVHSLRLESAAKESLRKVQKMATAAADQAGQLQTIATSKADPEMHLIMLAALKDDVNRMGLEMSYLENRRDSLAFWEQQAVDKVLPLVQASAQNAQWAIEFFNENRSRLWSEGYREHAGQIRQDSERISKTLINYLKYNRLREQEVQAEERIWTDSQSSGE